MDDQNGSSTLTRGFFKFICPASVIGHGLATERAIKTFIFEIGVVDHDDDGFALNVDASIIVPALFRGDNAVADKDHFALLNIGFGCLAVTADDIFVAIGK